MEWVPKMRDVVFNNVLQSPDSNVRNFSKQKIDAILKAIDELLKRAYSLIEKHEMKEQFCLKVAYMSLKSNFIDKKMQGIKGFIEIIKDIRTKTFRFLTLPNITSFIVENKIFEEIYNTSTHSQIILKSIDFFKTFISEDMLQNSQLEMLLAIAQKSDLETKESVLKLLSEASFFFKANHQEFLIERICEIPLQLFGTNELELLSNLVKQIKAEVKNEVKAADYFWKLISSKKEVVSQEMYHLASGSMAKLVKGYNFRAQKAYIMSKCCQNIGMNVSILPTLEILKSCLELATSAATEAEFPFKTGIIGNCDVIKALLEVWNSLFRFIGLESHIL